MCAGRSFCRPTLSPATEGAISSLSWILPMLALGCLAAIAVCVRRRIAPATATAVLPAHEVMPQAQRARDSHRAEIESESTTEALSGAKKGIQDGERDKDVTDAGGDRRPSVPLDEPSCANRHWDIEDVRGVCSLVDAHCERLDGGSQQSNVVRRELFVGRRDKLVRCGVVQSRRPRFERITGGDEEDCEYEI